MSRLLTSTSLSLVVLLAVWYAHTCLYTSIHLYKKKIKKMYYRKDKNQQYNGKYLYLLIICLQTVSVYSSDLRPFTFTVTAASNYLSPELSRLPPLHFASLSPSPTLNLKCSLHSLRNYPVTSSSQCQNSEGQGLRWLLPYPVFFMLIHIIFNYLYFMLLSIFFIFSLTNFYYYLSLISACRQWPLHNPVHRQVI